MVKLIKNKNSGFSIIEILVAITLIAVISVSIFNVNFYNSKVRRINDERTTALYYAVEGIEIAKMMRWDQLALGDYYFVKNGDVWDINSGSELIDNTYSRTVNVSSVSRQSVYQGNVFGDIVASGNVDPDTKKVTVTIDWLSRAGSNKQEFLETYIHRFSATRWTQTDWSGGSGQENWSEENKFFAKDYGIDVREPGIVSLTSGFIDWTNASTTSTFDTPGNFEDNDVFESDGYAYLVTKNNPAGKELYILDVSNPENAILKSSLDIGASVTSVVARGDIVYLSTALNEGELKVVNVSNKSDPFVIATIDLPSNTDALDLAVNNDQLYIIQGSKMYSFSITNPAVPALLDDIQVSDSMAGIHLSASYIYIATLDAAKELQVVNVTNPADMQVFGYYNLPGSLKGTDVAARGSRAYIATQNNGSGSEFFIFDVTNPANPVLIGEQEIGEMVHSFAIAGPYILLGTNFLNEELVVLDISNPTAVVQVAGFDLTGYVLGMSANCSLIYAATSGNSQEFFIISTGVVDCDYASSGILESSIYDTGSDNVFYNWISWSGSQPSDTTIRFQLATSNSIGGPWNFLGPDGTSSTYYTNSSSELINTNQHVNQRYIRYKLFLNSYNDLRVPVLDELTISYSVFL